MKAFTRSITGDFCVALTVVLGLCVPSAQAAMTLELHLAADSLTLTDGTSVSNWPDVSGHARHAGQATAALQPVFKTGILNGLPVVRFTGQGNSAPTEVDSLVVDFQATVSQPFTVFVVANILGAMPAPESTDYLFDDAAGGSRIIGGLGLNGLGQDGHLGMYAGAVLEVDNRSAWDQGWRIYEFHFNGSASIIYTNGGLFAGGNAGANAIHETTDLRIGAQFSNLYPFNGDMAEFRVYSGAPMFTERNAVGYALAGKYGLATAYTPPVNQAPTVAFIAPTNNSVLQLGPQTVTVSASDVDGSITNVTLHINGGRAIAFSSPPYAYIWRTGVTGAYELVAQAWDNEGASRAATVTVVRVSALTVGASADALISSIPGDRNYGRYVILETGPRFGTLERFLLKFDVSALPDVAPMLLEIESIQLHLRTSFVAPGSLSASERILEFRRVTNEWTEGLASGDWIDDVTWSNRTTGIPWGTPGGDIDPAVLGTYDWSAFPESAVALNASDIPFTVDILPGAANQSARNALIGGWFSGTNNGLYCMNITEAVNDFCLGVRARENTPGPGPAMEIRYSVSPAFQGTLITIR